MRGNKSSVPAAILAGVGLIFLISAVLAPAAHAAAGALDPLFNGTGIARYGFGPAAEECLAAAVQSDGKLVTGGWCENGGSYDWVVARYNADGSPDASFGSGGRSLVHIGNGGLCNGVRLQGDGRIVAAGWAYDSQYHEDFAVARLNADGSRDGSFGLNGAVTTAVGSGTDTPCGLRIQADGRIVVGGSSSSTAGGWDMACVRYNTDGSLDTSFDGDGKVVVAVGSGTDYAYAFTLQSDGKPLLAGYTDVGAGGYRMALVRLLTTGALDPAFDGDGRVTVPAFGTYDYARAVTIQAATSTQTDRIVVAGSTQLANGQRLVAVARYNLNGTLDTAFDTDGRLTTAVSSDCGASAVLVQSPNLNTRKIVVAGYTLAGPSGPQNFLIARYAASGALDATFSGDGLATPSLPGGYAEGRALVAMAGGTVVAGFGAVGTDVDAALLRLDNAGNLDATFDGDGIRLDNFGTRAAVARAVGRQSDGRIIAGGYWPATPSGFVAARYNLDGTLDSGFGAGGVASAPLSLAHAGAMVVQGDDRIVVAGSDGSGVSQRFAVARFTADGTLDTSFGTAGVARRAVGAGYNTAAGVAGLSGGRILVGGDSNYQDLFGIYTVFALVMLQPDGTPDASFGDNGVALTPVPGYPLAHGMAVQGDGRIVLAGESTDGATGLVAVTVARFTADGWLDTSFNGIGYVRTVVGSNDARANAVLIQPDGKIVVAGDAFAVDSDFLLIRYNADGTLDTTFDGDGIAQTAFSAPGIDHANALARQADGKFLVAGSTAHVNTKPQYALIRYLADGTVDAGYGMNGRVAFDLPGSLASDMANAVGLDAAGRALLAGDSSGLFGLARLQGDDVSAVPPPGPELRPLAITRVTPNPFRRATQIRFTLPVVRHAALRVFAADGSLVATLVDAVLPAGEHAIEWNGTGLSGRAVPSGVYFVRLDAGGRTTTARLLCIR